MDDYQLVLTFINGEQKIFNMKPYLDYPVFKPLKDLNEFNNYTIQDGTVEWKCGADLSPDTFYIESVPANNINHGLG